MFIQIDTSFLEQIATDSDRIPSLYYSKYKLVRKFFWMRLKLIFLLIKSRANARELKCMDFGDGGGVFLPTLSGYFKTVIGIDLEDQEAQEVLKQYQLNNVKLIKGDVAEVDIPKDTFDVVIAADVLEHFQDLSIAVDAIKKWLKTGGVLYTSLPTENWVYVFLRKIFNIEKPRDHYHTGCEVERILKNSGFKPLRRRYVPFILLPLFPLFLITEWRFDSEF
jgi:2-polyprenyl-3-methyl-5-hydroxy-6-metoxy-1,4-benzoquinol methylase